MFPDYCEKCGRKSVECRWIENRRSLTFYRRCFACGAVLTYKRRSYLGWLLFWSGHGLLLVSGVAGIWLYLVVILGLGG